MALQPDLILFNWGMHDGPLGNATVPGQNAPPNGYAEQLAVITALLLEYNATNGGKIAFVGTTPFLCDSDANGCVENLNNQAFTIMGELGIPVVSAYNAIINECGAVPVQQCFGEAGCFCPHCPPGYQWVVENVIEPFVRDILSD